MVQTDLSQLSASHSPAAVGLGLALQQPPPAPLAADGIAGRPVQSVQMIPVHPRLLFLCTHGSDCTGSWDPLALSPEGAGSSVMDGLAAGSMTRVCLSPGLCRHSTATPGNGSAHFSVSVSPDPLA